MWMISGLLFALFVPIHGYHKHNPTTAIHDPNFHGSHSVDLQVVANHPLKTSLKAGRSGAVDSMLEDRGALVGIMHERLRGNSVVGSLRLEIRTTSRSSDSETGKSNGVFTRRQDLSLQFGDEPAFLEFRNRRADSKL